MNTDPHPALDEILAGTNNVSGSGYTTRGIAQFMQTDPWSKLDTLLAATIEPMGPEWFTLPDLMARYNLTEPQARRQVKRMLRTGAIEAWAGGKGRKYRAL